MDSYVPDNVRLLLSSYIIDMDPDTQQDNLKCIRCGKLTLDAYQTYCECNYCRQCLVTYLEEGGTHCCGLKSACVEELLIINRNVIRNPSLNRKILRAKVICPNESCTHCTELTTMADHLRVCCKQSGDCNIEMTITDANKIDYRLLIDSINNIRKELAISKLEIVSLREETRLNKSRIDQQNNVFESVKEELRSKENIIEILERELGEVRNKSDLMANGKTSEREREMDGQGREIDSLKKIVNEVRNNVDLMMEERDKFGKKKKSKMNKLIKWNRLLCPDIDADFVWRFEECSEKMEQDIFSDSFYANDYKLCLRLCIYSNNNIGLGCIIMKGYNDDRLAWPMNHSVTVSIINQSTLGVHYSKTYKYDTYRRKKAFDRTNDKNSLGIGSLPFIEYSSIKDNPSITANDCIVVSCLLTPP